MSQKKNYVRSIGLVMIIMLAGKLLSLVANQVYMSYFGSGSEQINIYSYAIQIPNYLFQTLGTAISSVVIPIYAGLIAQERKSEANRFGSNIVTVSSIITLLLIAVGLGLSFVLPSLTKFDDKAFAGTALRIMMPVMLFYCLSYAFQGILQSLGEFTIPALVNLPSGILIILYIKFGAEKYGVTGLLVTTLIGLFLQFAILVLPAHKKGFRYRFTVDLKDSQLRTAGRMTLPIIVGAGAYQLNMLFNNTLMTRVSPDSVTLFNFVQNLILSSVMTIVLAVTSVMYPTLTAFEAKGDKEGFRQALFSTVSSMLFVLIPITAGLVLMRTEFLTLISKWGAITGDNIRVESLFLLAYCLSVPFLGVKEIADRAFYSMKTTKISAITGVMIMLINIVLGYFLSKTGLRQFGIPLAYSIAAATGTVFLVIKLVKRIGRPGASLYAGLGKTLVSTALMSAAVWGVSAVVPKGDALTSRIAALGIPAAAGIVVYFVSSLIIKNPSLNILLGKFLRKGGGEDGEG